MARNRRVPDLGGTHVPISTRGLVAAVGAALATTALVLPSAPTPTEPVRTSAASRTPAPRRPRPATRTASRRSARSAQADDEQGTGRLRPGRHPSAYNLSSSARARRSPSSTPSTTRTPRPTSPSTARQYGLPACTTANGCFRKVNQTGGTTPTRRATPAGARRSRSTSTWSRRPARTARSCSSRRTRNSFANLGAAVNYAATQGVAAISNSYGGGDQAAARGVQPPGHRHHRVAPATTATASSSPASFDTVIAVGGTSLHARAATRAAGARPRGAAPARGCSTPEPATGVADRVGHAVPERQGERGRVRRRRPEHRRRRLRHLRLRRLAGLRRHQRLGADHRAACTRWPATWRGYPAKYTWTHQTGLYDVTSGSNGTCPTAVLVPRRRRLGRPDRARHAERSELLLIR